MYTQVCADMVHCRKVAICGDYREAGPHILIEAREWKSWSGPTCIVNHRKPSPLLSNNEWRCSSFAVETRSRVIGCHLPSLSRDISRSRSCQRLSEEPQGLLLSCELRRGPKIYSADGSTPIPGVPAIALVRSYQYWFPRAYQSFDHPGASFGVGLSFTYISYQGYIMIHHVPLHL